jgi:hypothetical protein
MFGTHWRLTGASSVISTVSQSFRIASRRFAHTPAMPLSKLHGVKLPASADLHGAYGIVHDARFYLMTATAAVSTGSENR